MDNNDVDDMFGKGNWRAIQRSGINQHGKVRGIDNARASKTNFAAWLEDTIFTTPADIAIQTVCWLFNGKLGTKRKETYPDLWVGLSADDLENA